MRTTTNKRLAFTLVELLVVIGIISMLASLLLPAVQAAREQGRRAQCISNQNQIAFALLNYESTKQSFPALRAPLKPAVWTTYTNGVLDYPIPPTGTNFTNADFTSLTWVGFLLPFVEQLPAWQRISNGSLIAVNLQGGEDTATLYDLGLPVMKCVSSGGSANDSRISYVVNAGPLNPIVNNVNQEYGTLYQPNPSTNAQLLTREEGEKMYTLFFDHFAGTGQWAYIGATPPLITPCKTRVRLDDIDGTSTTILLSENENAGRWIWYEPGTTPVAVIPTARPIDNAGYYIDGITDAATIDNIINMERLVGFCYPNQFEIVTINGIQIEEYPIYVPLAGNLNLYSPLFLNEGRRSSGLIPTEPARLARPSSGHPGVVVTTFCDRGVRPLRDDMDKLLFVRLCRPSSGVIINLRDL